MSNYLEVAREIMRARQGNPEPRGDEPLELVLAGKAIELWSDALSERFWLVADEGDAILLGEPRGSIYTAAEARRVIQIADPKVVAEIHRWKRLFNGNVRDYQKEQQR